MGFVALIFALLIEQGRPLPDGNVVQRALNGMADAVMRGTNAGKRRHGVAGWFVIVGAATVLVGGLHWLLSAVHPLAVFCLHVVVLYLTVGFRQFSHPFSEIQLALAAGDIPAARATLQAWMRRHDPDYVVGDAPVSEICRIAISKALLAAHTHVLGPLFWYILLPGPIGPVLYRTAELLARRWDHPGEPYGEFAQTAYRVLDWLPLRLSATGFAITGNFEDAVYAWRGTASGAADSDPQSLLLATGGGALGLRLADPQTEARWAANAEAGFEPQGAEPGSDGMYSAVGLVWRSVVLWVSLFAMLTIATWLGR